MTVTVDTRALTDNVQSTNQVSFKVKPDAQNAIELAKLDRIIDLSLLYHFYQKCLFIILAQGLIKLY